MRTTHRYLRVSLVLLTLAMLLGVTLWQATGIDSAQAHSNRFPPNQSAAKDHVVRATIELKQALVADQEQRSRETRLAVATAQANYDQAVAARVAEIRDRL